MTASDVGTILAMLLNFVLVLVFGPALLMLCWNAVLPQVAGLPEIGFLEALALWGLTGIVIRAGRG